MASVSACTKKWYTSGTPVFFSVHWPEEVVLEFAPSVWWGVDVIGGLLGAGVDVVGFGCWPEDAGVDDVVGFCCWLEDVGVDDVVGFCCWLEDAGVGDVVCFGC